MPEFSTLSLRNDANLQGYYKLENVNDELGTTNLTNNNTVTFTSAVYNNGANTGTANTNKYLSAASRLAYAGGAYSISLWVRLLTDGNINIRFATLLDNDTSNTVLQMGYYQSAGNQFLYLTRTKIGGADQGINYQVTAFGTTDFNHIVLAYDAAQIIGYLNNIAIGTVSASGDGATTTANNFNIGALNVSGTPVNFASVIIDDVALFNRNLTASDVNIIYNGDPTSGPNARRSLLGVGR